MKLLRMMIRLGKYYIPVHILTLFIYQYKPGTAVLYYVIGLVLMAYVMFRGGRYITYMIINFHLVLLLYLASSFGFMFTVFAILIILLFWRDIILAIR